MCADRVADRVADKYLQHNKNEYIITNFYSKIFIFTTDLIRLFIEDRYVI